MGRSSVPTGSSPDSTTAPPSSACCPIDRAVYVTQAGDLLDLVAELGIPEERTRAAGDIGRALGGDRLIVFVRDDEVGVLLPAPGFPKTFRDPAAWHRFLDACVAHGEHLVD